MFKLKHLISGLFLFLLFTCEQSDEFPELSRSYPVLVTESVTDIDSKGVLLEATLSLTEEEEITSFGFEILGEDGFFKVELADWKSIDDFSYRLTSNHTEGTEILFRAYVTTTNLELIGAEKTFISQGSSLPEIIDFYPKTATIQSEITVLARNIGVNQTNITPVGQGGRGQRGLAFSLRKAEIDTIKFHLPPSILNGPSTSINIESGETLLQLNPQLEILRPAITSVDKTIGFNNETEFTITLENFNPTLSTRFQSFQLKISTLSSTLEPLPAIITKTTPNTITFKSGFNNLNGEASVILILNDIFETELESTIDLQSRWETVDFIRLSIPGTFFSGTVGNNAYFLGNTVSWAYSITGLASIGPLARQPFSPNASTQAFIIEDNIYAGSGTRDRRFFKYNTVDNSWTQLNDFLFPRFENVLMHSVQNGKYHVITINSSTGGPQNKHYIYDPTIDSWSSQTFNIPGSSPTLSQNATFFTKDNLLHYLATDFEEKTLQLYTIDFSDLNSGFSLLSTFNDPDLTTGFHGNNPIYNGELVAFTGGLSNHQHYVYNFLTDQWTKTSPNPSQDMSLGFSSEENLFGVDIDHLFGTIRVYRYKKEL